MIELGPADVSSASSLSFTFTLVSFSCFPVASISLHDLIVVGLVYQTGVQAVQSLRRVSETHG